MIIAGITVTLIVVNGSWQMGQTPMSCDGMCAPCDMCHAMNSINIVIKINILLVSTHKKSYFHLNTNNKSFYTSKSFKHSKTNNCILNHQNLNNHLYQHLHHFHYLLEQLCRRIELQVIGEWY